MKRSMACLLVACGCGARSELDGTALPDAASDVNVTDAADDASTPVVVLATGHPYAIAVDDANVYWTDALGSSKATLNPVIVACATKGCAGLPTVVVSGEAIDVMATAHSLAVNATSLYWFAHHDSGASVMTCPKATCQSPTVVTSSDSITSNGVAASDTHVFWTDGGYNSVGGNIFSCPALGCVGPPAAFASHQVGPGDITVASGAVYWANFNTIMTCPEIGCSTPITVASVPFLPQSISASATGVDWSRAGAIEGCQSGGCSGAPTAIVSPFPHVSVVATDGISVYFAVEGTLMKCPVAGCTTPPKTLATFTGAVGGIAVDATSVYWTTHDASALGSGEVLKLTPK